MASYTLGLDLGQTRDPSVLIIAERLLFREDMHHEHEDHWWVRHVQRFDIGTSYPDIVAEVGMLMESDRLRDQCKLRFDATGVGAAVADMFRQAYLDKKLGTTYPEPIKITGGESAKRALHVPKVDLVGNLQRLMQERRLAVDPNLPGASKLYQELTDFSAKISAAGRDRFEAATESAHDDHVIALALATHRPHHIGEPRFVSAPDADGTVHVVDAIEPGWS